MSNIYVQEPPCSGKVTFETTVGEIDIELWSAECPKACRNFIQLCMEGYYNGTKFFRVVPDFIVQGGDPTNTGTGGESIWGKPFKDEFHQRLRMVRRGLVCMANAGKDDNGSQFFFTLAATRELQNKHTVFGKVGGDTIFNMLRLATGHLEDGDRPKYPHRIISAQVQVNPFDDIVPRETISQELEDKAEKKKKKSKAKAHKAFNVLSFGAEAEEEEEDLVQAIGADKGKSKSAHDLAKDPKLGGLDQHQARDQLGIADESSSEEEDEDAEELKRQQAQAKLDSVKNKLVKRKAEKELMDIRTKVKKTDAVEEFIKKEQSKAGNEEDFEGDYECPIIKDKARKKMEIQKELKALTKELRPKKKKERMVEAEEDKKEEEEVETKEKNDVLESYHKEKKRYAEAKASKPIPKQKASREEQTLALLAKFKQKLSGIKYDDDDEAKKSETKDAKKADEKTEADEEEDEEIVGDDWMKNSLVFENDAPVLAKDASSKDDDWFDIYDPRNPINKRRREQDAQDGRKREKDRMRRVI